MKHRMSNNVICPYYRCEERQVIYCEGVEPNTAIHLAFAIPPQLKDYKKAYCEKAYNYCLIADMLNRKWDDAPEGGRDA